MCGIAGLVNFQGKHIQESTIDQMNQAQRHRGPDGNGIFLDDQVGLGHCRLSIIDLSNYAVQPMLSNDKNYVITYNGELYNYKQIRRELEKAGFCFFSNSDTEVVLNAYIHWGSKCLNKFNGVFAFAIYNRLKKNIFLARDRYGVKPLYYTFWNAQFAFASEQKALLCLSDIKRKLDIVTLKEYFTFQNIFSNRTFLENISIFPAGHFTMVDCTQCTSELLLQKYWDYSFQEEDMLADENEYIEEVDRLFQQAVNRQMVGDAPIGTYLSGGIDSGGITAIAANHTPYLPTFTCGFDLNNVSDLERGFDERLYAEMMSYQFKTEHYEMVLKSGDMERCMKKLVYHVEDPRVGQSYPNYYVSKLASKFVKVILSGSGGDELFGGYPWRYYRALNKANFNEYIDSYYTFWQRLVSDQEMEHLFKPIQNEMPDVSMKEVFRSIFQENNKMINSSEEYINYSMYFEAKTFLHGLLIVEDKISMAHGLETRVPFLDNDLVDFATKIPVRYKLKNLKNIEKLNENEHGPKANRYYSKNKDGKIILRQALEKYLPPSISQGVKQGFSAPDASWFRNESASFIYDIINNDDSLLYNYLDHATVRNIVSKHAKGKENRRLFIWSLINFEYWCQQFLN